jgi:hypothetical protein
MPMGIGSLLRPNLQGLERQRIQAMMGINPYWGNATGNRFF